MTNPRPDQARRDLQIVQEETRRMDLLRRLHGVPALLALWGTVIVVGNLVWWRSPEATDRSIELGWVGLAGLAIAASGLLEWRLRLRTMEPWRMWGMMCLLLVHGWAVARLVDFSEIRQGAVYITAFILVGWALTALLFRALPGFLLSLVLLALAYGGYALTTSSSALLIWLAASIGGSMWALAIALAAVERRLKKNARPWQEGEQDA